MSEKKVIFVLGGPGCGKGTQAKAIAEQYGFGYAAAGDMLRAEAAKGDSPNAKRIAQIINNGELVPPPLICETIKKTIEESPYKFFLMDGFPRSIEQDDAFRQIVPPCDSVALLDAPDEVLIARCLSRGETSNRADDNRKVIDRRIGIYKRETVPVIERYRQEGKVFVVDANQPIEKVREDFVAELKKHFEF